MGCPKNKFLKNIEFRFLGRMREILAVHLKKTNNRQNSAMNFRYSQILMSNCLDGRETYQKIQSVSKSDEK